MKTYLFPASLAALAVLTQPLAAQSDGESTVVVIAPLPSQDSWVQIMSSQLDAGLRRQRLPIAHTTSPAGVVQIAFRSGLSGNATDISVFRSSGSNVIDRMSLRAVRELHSMRPQPRSFGTDQRYLANIVIANSSSEMRRLHAKLDRIEKARIASGMRSEFIALGSVRKLPG